MGRERRGKRIVVWPVYIDSSSPRSMGRKISLSKAVKKPTIEEIYKAAEGLGLNPEIEEARYPRNWALYKARVVVDKKGRKLEILERIADAIRHARGERDRSARR